MFLPVFMLLLALTGLAHARECTETIHRDVSIPQTEAPKSAPATWAFLRDQIESSLDTGLSSDYDVSFIGSLEYPKVYNIYFNYTTMREGDNNTFEPTGYTCVNFKVNVMGVNECEVAQQRGYRLCPEHSHCVDLDVGYDCECEENHIPKYDDHTGELSRCENADCNGIKCSTGKECTVFDKKPMCVCKKDYLPLTDKFCIKPESIELVGPAYMQLKQGDMYQEHFLKVTEEQDKDTTEADKRKKLQRKALDENISDEERKALEALNEEEEERKEFMDSLFRLVHIHYSNPGIHQRPLRIVDEVIVNYSITLDEERLHEESSLKGEEEEKVNFGQMTHSTTRYVSVEDVDECSYKGPHAFLKHTCGLGQDCKNTIGSYECVCHEGEHTHYVQDPVTGKCVNIHPLAILIDDHCQDMFFESLQPKIVQVNQNRYFVSEKGEGEDRDQEEEGSSSEVQLQTISFDMEKEYIRSVASSSVRSQDCVKGTGYIYEGGEEKKVDLNTQELFAHSNLDVLDMVYVPYTDFTDKEVNMFWEYIHSFTIGQKEAKKETSEPGENQEQESDNNDNNDNHDDDHHDGSDDMNTFVFSESYLQHMDNPDAIMKLPLRKYKLLLPLNTKPKQVYNNQDQEEDEHHQQQQEQEEEEDSVTMSSHAIHIFVFNEEYNHMKENDQKFQETKSKLTLFSYFILATVLLYLLSHLWTYLTFNYLYHFNKQELKKDRQKFMIGLKLTLLLHSFGGLNEMEREREATTQWMELHQD